MSDSQNLITKAFGSSVPASTVKVNNAFKRIAIMSDRCNYCIREFMEFGR